jgi:hypothetical protein
MAIDAMLIKKEGITLVDTENDYPVHGALQ